MKIFIIRQSAVLPSDENNPKEWREVILYRWAKRLSSTVKIICSSFDHYSLKQRRKPYFSDDVITLSTFGYRKTISVLRVLDSWFFSLKLFFFTLHNVSGEDKILISMPTPESVFAVSLAKKFKGFNLIVDVRDNWPDALPDNSLKAPFSKYVNLLNRFTFKSANIITFMSQGLLNNYTKKSLIPDHSKVEFLPLIYKKNFNSSQEEIHDYDRFFQKPCISFFGTLNTQFDFNYLKTEILESKLSEKFNFLIAGSGSSAEQIKHDFRLYENVVFLGQIPHEHTVHIAGRSVGFLLLYRDPCNFENHITNKIREYAEHKKIIIHNLESSKFNVLGRDLEIGVSIKQKNADSILNTILNESLDKVAKNLEELCKLASEENINIIFKKIMNK